MGGTPSAASPHRIARSVLSYLSCFQTFSGSFASAENTTLLFSNTFPLFAEKMGDYFPQARKPGAQLTRLSLPFYFFASLVSAIGNRVGDSGGASAMASNSG